jgi:type I restriction enzyme S subunit
MSSGEQVEPSLFITENHYARLKEQGGVPQIGDLLMPSICPDGRIYKVINNEPFYFKDGRVLWIKVNEDYYDSTFLKYLLKEKFLRSYTNIASGTTFAELKIFALKDLELIAPTLTLQRKFAQFIESAFTQLERSRKVYKATNSLFNSLIQKAFKGELV